MGIRLASLYCMSQLLLRVQKRGRMYFQHDGAPPHSSREVRNFLNSRFPGRWIGRSGPHNWPARSPDLIPLGYCVWGWMKELVYSVTVVTRDELLSLILDAADRIINSSFSKTSFKHRSVQIKGNFTKLTLHLYFKCIMYYAGLLFCPVYCK